MTYFIVRVLVNAIALAITIALLPGIRINIEPEAFDLLPEMVNAIVIIMYLLSGLLFGLLNAFVRPLVLFITGNLLISQMAFVVLLTNTILMYLLEISTDFFIAEGLLALVAAGTVMAGTVFVVEAIFGLDSPTFEGGSDDMPFYWRWLARIPTGRRNRIIENMRLRSVYNTIWRYGVDIVLDQSPLAGFRQFMQRLIYRRKHAIIDESMAATVRLMLQELGPTYVKIGQLISSRAEALPDDFKYEFEHLQSNVPPFDSEVARDIVTRELRQPPETVFASFDADPFAAASTAQVHKATLHDGSEVVVKVQRPNIRTLVRTDLNVMRDVTRVLEQRVAWARANDISGVLNEFADNVLEELDYENEAYNATRLAHDMAVFETVRVPRIYPDLSTGCVLTMEFVRGAKITDVAAIDAAGIDREKLATDYTEAILKQVLFEGFFHGDPHPGNLMVDLESGQVIFLDLGMVGTLTPDQRLSLGELVWALKQQDSRAIAQAAISLSDVLRPLDQKAFIQDMDRLVKRYLVYADKEISFAKVMSETMRIMYNHGLRMKHELTLAVKAVMQSEEVVRVLAPQLVMIDVAFEAVRRLLMQQMSTENLTQVAEQQINRTAREVVRQIPELGEATLRWITQYKRGRVSVDVDVNTDKLTEQIERVRVSIEQLTVGLLIVGLLVASAIASSVPLSEDWSGLPVIAFFLFIGAAAFGFYYIWRMLRDVGRSRREARDKRW